MLLVQQPTLGSSVLWMKKHLKNSKVSVAISYCFPFFKSLTNLNPLIKYLNLHGLQMAGLPGVLWVLPDSYIDVKNKDYGGALFIWSL